MGAIIFKNYRPILVQYTLREKCPNAEYLSAFSPNARKYGPEKTPYLDTFHAVISERYLPKYCNIYRS